MKNPFDHPPDPLPVQEGGGNHNWGYYTQWYLPTQVRRQYLVPAWLWTNRGDCSSLQGVRFGIPGYAVLAPSG